MRRKFIVGKARNSHNYSFEEIYPFPPQGFVEKDGEYLCPAHGRLKPPVKDKKGARRPRKVGQWRVGDFVIAKYGGKFCKGKISRLIANGKVKKNISRWQRNSHLFKTDLPVSSRLLKLISLMEKFRLRFLLLML